MIYKLKLIGFRLLLIAALFSVMINIAYGAEEDDGVKYKILKAPPDVQMIFDKLLSVSRVPGEVTLYVSTSPVVNAYTTPSAEVVVFQGTLNMVMRDNNSADQLAAIMAHEISHYAFKHVGIKGLYCQSSKAANRNCEREADSEGIKLMSDAGFNCEGAAGFWRDSLSRWGDSYTPNSSHPSDTERLANAKRSCSVYVKTGLLPLVNYESVMKTENGSDN